MLVIKRYPNRKLYDTEAREYIALEGVARLVRAGVEVQVVDHATGEDLTTLILSQIIVEQARQASSSLPRSVLTALVQAGGDAWTTLRRGLFSSPDLMRRVDDEIERRLQGLVQIGVLAEEEGHTLREKLVALGGLLTSDGWPDEQMVRRALARRGIPGRPEIQALTAQLDALEAAVEGLSRGDAVEKQGVNPPGCCPEDLSAS